MARQRGKKNNPQYSCVIRIKSDMMQFFSALLEFSILPFFHFPSDFIVAARCVNEHRMHLCLLNYNNLWGRVVYL